MKVKHGPSGKVTALWPGSSLHYLQVLSEDRWEDYDWEYESERYTYWGSGVSWVEDPQGDPLGIDARESWKMSTVPRPGADLAFYLVESYPLPKDVMPEFDLTQHSATEDANSEQTGWEDMDNAIGHTDKDAVVTATLDRLPTAVTVRAS